MNIQEYTTMLSQIRELSCHIRVDRFKYICAAEGIRERKAMEMYKHFQILADGRIPWPDHKEATPEYLQQIVDLAERAKAEYDHDIYALVDLTNFNYHRYGDDFKYALYIFGKEGEPKRVEEFRIDDHDTYISVALLIKGGWALKHVIRQCDQTSDTTRYLNFTEDERRQRLKLRIYDGDVFEVVPSDSLLGHADECGMYLCHNGAYRKLVYIPGKGYISNKKPFVDEDVAEISIDEHGPFNSHKITWDGFRKVGNIHIDLGCLIEKQQENA